MSVWENLCRDVLALKAMGSSHLVPGGVGVCWQEAENDDEGPDELSADVVDKPSTFYQHKRMVVQVLKREIIEKSSSSGATSSCRFLALLPHPLSLP